VDAAYLVRIVRERSQHLLELPGRIGVAAEDDSESGHVGGRVGPFGGRSA
jgi:hypothetical protein